jgi:phenylacetate-CoA ligase
VEVQGPMWLNNPSARDAFLAESEQLKELERCRYSPELVGEIQRQKLDILWQSAADVPHYRGLPGFAERDLTRLAVTTKDDLKSRPAEFLRPGPLAAAKYYESSGSSGRPTPTPRTLDDTIRNVIGVCGMWRRALGTEPCRVAALLPSDVVPVGDFVASACEFLGHTLLRCYPFCLGMCDWDRLETLFRSYQPDRLFAAPGTLAQLTRILKRRGALAEMSASVRTILLLGEVCLPGQRRKLAADWDADVLDASYGSTETGTIAATCERGGMHLLLPSHIVELRNASAMSPADPGGNGELVVTTLNNRLRPLLRFATGDIADLPTQACPCGVPLPTVRIHGRQSDGVALRGVPLSEQLVGSIVYDDPRLTGYLLQLNADGKGRLVLEKDVDVTADDSALVRAAQARSEAAGIEWDDIVVVGQLPVTSKSGGSQKNWKRTNVVMA